MGAGRLVVIMISDATHEPEADPAIRKEFKYLRRTSDKRGEPSLVDSAATEKPHVGEHLIVERGIEKTDELRRLKNARNRKFESISLQQ